MRLRCLEKPRGLAQRLRFAMMRALAGRVPASILALSYQRDLCGKFLAPCYHQGLGRAREWSVGEIEIFAAFVSNLNHCQY